MRSKGESYRCPRPGCDARFDINNEYLVHTSYHQHHDKIRQAGLMHLKSLEEDLGQKLTCPLTDRVECSLINFPQLPTALICGWSYCHEQFVNAELYYKHVGFHAKEDGPGELKVCRWGDCGQKFRTMTLLKDHLRVHTLEKQYICPRCGNFYSTKIKFGDHFLRHLELELPEALSDIAPTEIQSAKIEGLKTQVQKYNVAGLPKTLFKCTQEGCNRMFPTSSLLREHVRTHSNAFKCTQCSFTTQCVPRLNSHILYRHRSLRPFQCRLCPANFKQRSDLRRHIKTHQIPTEPFRCNICGFETHNEDLLTRHMDVHRDSKRYLCHVCNNLFSRGNNLSRHLIAVHHYSLPDGQAKFKYKELNDGTFLLDTGIDIKELQAD